MTERHSIRNGTIAGLLVVVITAFTQFLWSWVGPAWSFVQDVSRWVWGVSIAPVPVPRLIVAAVMIGIAVRLVAWIRRRRPAQSAQEPRKEALPSQLSDLERAILLALVQADGSSIAYSDFKYHVNANNVRITEALEGLLRRGLIDTQHNVIRGTTVLLSRSGRQHAIHSGLA